MIARRVRIEARVRRATGRSPDRDPESTRSILLVVPDLRVGRRSGELPRWPALPEGRVQRARTRLVGLGGGGGLAVAVIAYLATR